jgi:predicted TIM-barrel fold metal-dependent hydrolase
MGAIDDYILQKVREHGRGGTTVTFIPEPEAEQVFCPMISVDDHALEPATLFEGRVPARLKDKVPYLGPGEDGAPWWVIDDAQVPILMHNGACGRPMQEWVLAASNFEEFRRGVWDPRARLADMDLTGVWAQLCFPSLIWGFAGWRFSRMRDAEAGLASLRAYNQWMLEEWCGTDRNRFLPCQLPWLADPEIAAQEIYANAERGFTSVSFSENPEGLGYPNVYQRHWDPFFRACEETQTVINLHVGSSGKTQQPSSSSAEEVPTALFPVSGLEALVDWVYSGVLFRFPGLKLALSEAGVSWVPMALERLRRAYRQSTGIGKGWPADQPDPTEIAKRNFFFTSIEDPAAFQMLHLIGEDNVMAETDYPHSDSTWPHSQAMIRGELRDLDPVVIRKICYGNAARIYRHPEPPQEMIARSEVGLPAPAAA